MVGIHWAALALAVLPVATASAQVPAGWVQTGDPIVLMLTDEVATRYLRLCGQSVTDDGAADGVTIAVEGSIIAADRAPKELVVRVVSPRGSGEASELVTLTAAFDPSRLRLPPRRRPIPQPDAPLVDSGSSLAERFMTLPTLRVATMKDVSLRRWKLVEEVHE